MTQREPPSKQGHTEILAVVVEPEIASVARLADSNERAPLTAPGTQHPVYMPMGVADNRGSVTAGAQSRILKFFPTNASLAALLQVINRLPTRETQPAVTLQSGAGAHRRRKGFPRSRTGFEEPGR